APTKNPVQGGAIDNSTGCSAGPCVRSLVLANGAPAGSEYGLITRNIPSGTQAVSGTFWQATQPVSGTVTANQGGTWTVQPGNTANTTPWLATISQGGNAAAVSASNGLKVDAGAGWGLGIGSTTSGSLQSLVGGAVSKIGRATCR